ncbi:response regulator [Candidatus Magnetaquicoccus inordinatus]|uniref:response regulator n=1 Tax=Candidatus Magnetaquicoccus inordinatus TaxID=2496818 RepID=UPI00102C6185|nr:response regulator [Candidatus Magnetaquicoccus inordinatus]
MSSRSQVLIVDDEAELRDNLSAVLEYEGFQVVTAASGAEGIHLMSAQRFDVILLDLIMPGQDGIDTMLEMRRFNNQTRYIIMTAYATVNTAVQAIRKGASDYLSKPFRVEELVAVIKRSLEEARFERQIVACNLDKTLTSLANPIRRRIIELMGCAPLLRMTDISQALEIDDHTKTMFHLRTLKEAGLLHQPDDKSYALTPAGSNAFNLLRLFNNRES